MKNLEKHKKLIENNLLYVATTSETKKPHVIVCGCCKVNDNKILITDNYMKTTKENVINNNKISLCVGSEEDGFLYVDGVVEYKVLGKEYDFVKSLEDNKGLPCKGVLVVTTDSFVYDK